MTSLHKKMPCDTMSRENEQTTCSICLEEATGDIRQLQCGHRFHTSCYNTWAQRCNGQITCPNCRAPSSDERGNRPQNILHGGHRSQNIFNHRTEWPVNYMHFRRSHISHDPDLPNIRDMTPAELIAMLAVLAIALATMSIFASVSSTCMCRLHWAPGQTNLIEKSFWGGQSVYTRPDMCTYVC